MESLTFIDSLTQELTKKYTNNPSNLTIVLPSKRARIFFLRSLQKITEQPIFAPKVISVEDFIQEIAGIRTIDSIEVLFEFFTIYNQITPKENQQDFITFSNWAKTALQDFNEIDRYLIDEKHVFSYLKDIKALERWQLEAEEKTSLMDKTLEFWHKLPQYYATLYAHLLQKKVGYQGMVYREAVKNIVTFSKNVKATKIIFAGFNALNQAEEKIMQYLLIEQQAEVFWDIDYTLLQDNYHDAGLFMRKYKKEWKNEAQQPFNWIENHFENPKNIHIIGTPKSVGQAKIVGSTIEKILTENTQNLQNTAVVLGDENLLLPVLFNLPSQIETLNITMGYSSKNNPAQLLLSKLFKLHQNAITRNEKSYTFYYKEVLDILNHSFIEPYADFSKIVSILKSNNFTFFSNEKLFELYAKAYPDKESELFTLLFKKWNTLSVAEIIETISAILFQIKAFLSTEKEHEKVSNAFLYSVYQVVTKVSTYVEKYNSIPNVEALQAVFKQLLDLADVSFEGEPLTGLQIMGVLESRVLDFENVIITSVNEGTFPSGKTPNSFIPFDVKKELGLPTSKEKDAIYSYHFYHLLFRAKNIYLLYNTESEGIDAGEKSRFITQLEIEFEKHVVENTIYNAILPKQAYQPICIEKTTEIEARLREIATINGFSPSALTNYLRNPIQFYMQRILGLKETDEVEENIAMNTLGTVIHETLQVLYEPYSNVFLTEENLASMLQLVEEKTIEQFKKIYKEGEIKKGKNLLAFEVAKQNINQFLQQEKTAIQNGDAIKILFLEAPLFCVLESNELPYPIKIAGKVDRIEYRNGVVRIIDYKTGKVEANNLKINNFEDLVADVKYEKIIQLLCYALMWKNNEKSKIEEELEVGIYSFKNSKAGFMPFTLGTKKELAQTIINTEILEDFKSQLVQLILTILDKKIPFEEKE